MSDFFENEKDIETKDSNETAAEIAADTAEMEELSTIFSAPEEKRAYSPKNAGRKKVMSLVAALVAVAVLVSGTIAVIKLIPEKTEDSTDQVTSDNTISVLSLDYTLFEKVTVTNENGSFVFSSKKTTEKDENGKETENTTWSLAEFDDERISSYLIDSVVSTLGSISATRHITEKTAEDCGFSEPSCKVDVESQKYGNFSVLLGSDSPDNTGVYLKLSNKDDIYLVNDSVASSFDFDYIDLANAKGFNGIDTTNLSAYLDSEGALSSFDRLTISGKEFSEPMVFEPNSDEFLKDFVPFVVTSPVRQESDKLTEVLTMFASGLASDGAYSFEINAEELKKFGLDNPDFVITINVGSVNKTYKISAVDESYCAVIDEDSVMIEKVAISNIPFIDYSPTDFYSTWVFLRLIDAIDTITFDVEGNVYDFDIGYTEKENSKTYKVSLGDKKLTAEKFQDFYSEFISLQAADFKVSDTDLEPELTVTVVYTDSHTEVLTFTRTAATKYQYAINGRNIGRITSSSYNKIIKYLKLVAQNKAIK